ncbi:hypothetical protein EBR96_09635 [bacterium]|nr:hypothetical protein [bacterium]
MSKNDSIFKFLKENIQRLSKSRSDRGNIIGASVENPSSMKFVITILTPKRLYGAGLNVYDFLNSFGPFVDVEIDTGDVGADKFTKYTLTV